MRAFNGTSGYTKYNNFKVASEFEKYNLTSLGTCTGNAGKSMILWFSLKRVDLSITYLFR